jgi:RHS repeat-associated protein
VQIYDKDGRQIDTIDSLGNTTTTLYDTAGRVTETFDADGNPTTYGYDKDGNQTSVTDAYGKSSYTYYDGDGNVTETIDADGNATYMGYDAQGRQTSTEEPSTQTENTYYDLAGNVTKNTDYDGNTSYTGYDSDDRVTSTTDGNGNISYQYYDTAGDVTMSVSGTGQSTTFAYDNDHRQTSMTSPIGQTSLTFYDANGNVTETKDALSETTKTGYDGDGRVTSQTDGDGDVTTTAFDKDGNTLSVTDPDNNVTQYQYNSVDELTLTTAPNGSLTTMTYDAAGNVSTMIDGDSRTTTYSYDQDNREVGESWKNSGGTTTDVLTFTYDNNGNMVTAANSAGMDSFAYNDNNQTTAQTDVFGLTTTYAYDPNGNVTQRLDSLGGTTHYSFDGNGNLSSESFSGTGQSPMSALLTYTADNMLSSLTRYDSLTQSAANVVGTTMYSYDNADRVTAITTKSSTSTTLAYYDYAYDAANRVTVLTTMSGGAETFTYDAASQLLTDHLNGSPTTTYSYDNNGNRNMSGYTTGTENETTNDGTYTYTYDNVGNMIEQAAATGGTVMYYTYNQKNQVTSIEVTSNGTTAVSWTTFTYDALNRRVEQDTWQSGVGNSTTRMAYDINGQVWADLNGSNTLQTRYIMGIGLQQYFAREDSSGNVYWYVQDANYSVRDVLNSSGGDVDTITYTAYGDIVNQTGSSYTGVIGFGAYRIILSVPVLYGTSNRIYDPASGKWLEIDPKGFAGGLSNLSDYVGDDPTNATDPSGLEFSWSRLNTHTTVTIITDKTVSGDSFKNWWCIEGDHEPNISGPVALADYLGKYSDKSIDYLYLSGHGSRGGVQATKANINGATLTADPVTAERIARKLEPTAVVTILGCQCGMDSVDMQLMANVLGVSIKGNTGMVKAGSSGNGKWVTVSPQANRGKMEANGDKAVENQLFTEKQNGDGTVSFHADTGWLCAENGGGGDVVANRPVIAGWEMWTEVPRAGGKVAFKTTSGFYLCVEDGKVCTVDKSSWDGAEFVKEEHGNKVAFRLPNGKYLSAKPGS